MANPPLWPHQKQAVGAAIEALDQQEKALVSMACGTGKTRVGIEVAKRRKARWVVVVVPTLVLVAQLRAYL